MPVANSADSNVDASDRTLAGDAAIMLVGHGTRDAVGTEEFHRLGRLLAELVAPVPVQACLLEFQEPTIRQGWDRLIESGAREIRVAPLLLFAAGHAKSDIPDAIEACRRESEVADRPVVQIQSRPLSRHRAVVGLLARRIEQVRDRYDVDNAGPATRLVMVGRGSRDVCATADMRMLSELVRHRAGFDEVDTAFYAMAEPRVPEVLDRVAAELRNSAIPDPKCRPRVIVQPHLLFAGRLYEAIAKQVAEANHRHRGIDFVLADYLGPDRSIAEAVRDRIVHAVGTIGRGT